MNEQSCLRRTPYAALLFARFAAVLAAALALAAPVHAQQVFNGDPIDPATSRPYPLLPGVPLILPGPDERFETADDVINTWITGDADLVVRIGPIPSGPTPPPTWAAGGPAPRTTTAGGGSSGQGDETPFTVLVSNGTGSPPYGATITAGDLADWEETQVQPEQAAVLIGGLRATEGIEGCVVEVGAWRGVTTRYLAMSAGRSKVVGVDRWVRAKGDRNYEAFLRRTQDLANVAHERSHSGAAAMGWAHGPIRFLFIDAGHDYANVAHDLAAWRRHVAPGAIIAMHDCDDRNFAGCRLAIFEVADQFELFAHVPGLALLRVRH